MAAGDLGGPLHRHRRAGGSHRAHRAALTHILPWLVPLAALGLAVVTISPSVYHLRRREPPISAVVAVLALVVVFLRWQVVPISS